MWEWTITIPLIVGIIICGVKWKRVILGYFISHNSTVLAQLAMLEERTKYLEGIEESIEKIRDKQDADSRELREKLYSEYSKRLRDALNLY